MQVSVEHLSALERRLTVQFPTETIQENIQKRLSELQKKAVIKGFRPGKVPLSLVRERYTRQIREEVAQEHLDATWKEAFREADLHSVHAPVLESLDSNAERVEYKLWCEVAPTVELQDLATLEIEKPAASITEEDIAEEIKTLQWNKAEWVKVERPPQQGDEVVCHFTVQTGEEAFAALNQTYTFKMGGDLIPPPLEKALKEEGSPGKTLSVNIIPKKEEAFPFKFYADKTLRLSVEIKAVRSPILPELNENFFKSFNSEISDFEGFRSHLHKQMSTRLISCIEEKQMKNICQVLLDAHPLPALPKTQVAEEFLGFKRNYLSFQKWLARSSGSSGEEFPEEVKNNLEAKARNQVALNWVMRKIIDTYSIVVDEKEMQAEWEIHLREHPSQEEKEHNKEELLQGIRAKLLEKKIFETLLAQAKCVEKNYSYKELVKD
ncbi:MAG: trigger factor [Gammaproteobacteria bacterium]|nr:trigger factor [Gammaproteobacteria bacterium]